ncbi:hypothetical protein [Mycolicibacterium agri]|uniref:Secreted protein n=2 Tax=Mycolicibacterium agri TaxID=36811 RepID=A0A7I9WEY1_MYCAG|nr:hypothetical protein [Mycolicibacterium agri]GFG55796.1 hypothetical protein MAGR_72370 [Mycolicibacterium agri]
MNRIARWTVTAVVTGGVGLAGVGLTSATAAADPAWGPSYSGGNCPPGVGSCTRWCPGDPPIPGSEFGILTWDQNICHDWYWNSEGIVDIAANTVYPWHGAPHEAGPPPPPPQGPPPPPAPLPPDCPPINIPFLAPARCGGL